MGYFVLTGIVFLALSRMVSNSVVFIFAMTAWLAFSLAHYVIYRLQPRIHANMQAIHRRRSRAPDPAQAAKAREAEAVMRDFKLFEDEVDARTRHLRPEPKKRGPQNYAELHCHAILGITAADSQKTIKEAYRCKARQYHPDSAPDGLGSNTKFDMIKQAYEYAMYLRSRKI